MKGPSKRLLAIMDKDEVTPKKVTRHSPISKLTKLTKGSK